MLQVSPGLRRRIDWRLSDPDEEVAMTLSHETLTQVMDARSEAPDAVEAAAPPARPEDAPDGDSVGAGASQGELDLVEDD